MDNPRDQQRRLVLASGSRYRKELLERLGLRFEVAAPSVDETPQAAESPADTALRLAILKAKALQRAHGDALIIGSDQVASSGGQRFDKPGTHESAVRQLRALSGKTAQFDTAVALLDAASGQLQTRLVPCRVSFRHLEERLIQRYLEKEKPYDCAGAAKAEGLGIALIALSEMLSRAGLPPV